MTGPQHVPPEASAACRQHPDRIGGVTCQRCGAPMCPSCMHPASVGAHCPVCVRKHAQANRPVQRTIRRAERQQQPLVTMAIIAACAAVFVWDIAVSGLNTMSGGSVMRDLALWAPAVEFDNEWYRVVTSAFAHSGLIHIGFNMWLLWAIGATIEQAFGRLTFVTLYVAGIFGGALGAMLVEPRSSVVGASGAVFALMGAMLVLQRMGGVNVFQSGIGGLVLLNVALSFRSGVSLGGHIGGLAVGLAAGALIGCARRSGRQSLALVPVGIAAIGLAAMVALVPAIDRAIASF